MKIKHLFVSFALTLLWLWLGPPAVTATQDGAAAEGVTVCPAGPPACDYAVIQEAVDAAAPGDVVKIAGGVYTDVHGRPVPSGYPGFDIITQVVYISKTVSLRGGYTTAFSDPPDPQANPTTLDAQGRGRVLLIAGPSISPTIEGLHITGGDATGLWGDDRWADDAGGGVYVLTATVVFSHNQLFDNVASQSLHDYSSGGGMYLYQSDATLTSNDFFSNTAGLEGGGLSLRQSEATLIANTIRANVTTEELGWVVGGGGLFVGLSDATLEGNTIFDNTAGAAGGGVHGRESRLTLLGNVVSANTAANGPGGGVYLKDGELSFKDNTVSGNSAPEAGDGGGLSLMSSGARIGGNTITANQAAIFGGGLSLIDSTATISNNLISSNTVDHIGGGVLVGDSDVTLVNNLIADNQSNVAGSGLYVENSIARILHTTVARNTGRDGTGVTVSSYSDRPSSVWLTNTILISHTVGISVSAGNSARLEATLWGNEIDWAGPGAIITGTHNFWGDPAFLGPAAGDYHIGPTSAALDRGIPAGVLNDLDGDPRPSGPAPDLGADEYLQFPPCIPVTGVALSRVIPGTLYVGDTVQFSADPSPDEAAKPYTYTVSVDGQTVIVPVTGSADPLVFDHTFPTPGTYTITLRAWNCGMRATEAVSDRLSVDITQGYRIYLPVVVRDGP